MKTLLLIVEFISAALVVVLILLHSAKGEGLAGIGVQARLFSSQKGMEEGLNRLTFILTAIFMVTAGIFSVIY